MDIKMKKSDITLHVSWRESSSNSLSVRVNIPDGYDISEYGGFRLRIDGGEWVDCDSNKAVFEGLEPNTCYRVEGEYSDAGEWKPINHVITANLTAFPSTQGIMQAATQTRTFTRQFHPGGGAEETRPQEVDINGNI